MKPRGREWHIVAGALLGVVLAYLAVVVVELIGVGLDESKWWFVIICAWIGVFFGRFGYPSASTMQAMLDDWD